MNFKIQLDKKQIVLENVKVCDTFFSQLKGLMFLKNAPVLVFNFKRKSRRAIHSCFVKKPFLALWLDDNLVVDKKIIKTWKFSVKPKEKFNKLIEIPVDNFNILKFSVDLRKI